MSGQQTVAAGPAQTLKREAELTNPIIRIIPGLKREHPDELRPSKRSKVEKATNGKKDLGQVPGTATCRSAEPLRFEASLTVSGPVVID